MRSATRFGSVANCTDCTQFPITAQPWPGCGLRRASINSFGFGGSNAHVILDDASSFLRKNGRLGDHPTSFQDASLGIRSDNTTPAGPKTVDGDCPDDPFLLVWSAIDEKSLRRMEDEYTSRLSTLRLQDWEYKNHIYSLAYTLAQRRTRFSWRSFQVLYPGLSPHSNTQPSFRSNPVRALRDSKLCFVFTGQGAQWPEMGRGLFRFPVFRQTLQDAEAYIRFLGATWNLTGE